ncbi:TRAP transporter small permease [Ramlibacter humi]|uniref:TRAP transporter small permease protein n=1 Tax=Ramlibacter humi TaxID=2530451 RepID=A0A4Z0BHU6_9BURK|nr:TRAP transporter small permease [Ramlibacter humi]TFY97694.1 TRAP transporter small permease [Ramlibacter humi]
MLDRWLDRLDRLFSFLMVACLALMVVMVFGNVVLRYGFNSGITASEELSRWLFVWMTFLGAVVAMRSHAHLGTDSLVSRLPLAGKKACFVASHLLMLAICALMARGAWQQTVINAGSTSAVMEVSMAWFYVSGLMFAVLAGLVAVHELVKLFAGRLDEARLVAVSESDDPPHAGTQAAGTLKARP